MTRRKERASIEDFAAAPGISIPGAAHAEIESYLAKTNRTCTIAVDTCGDFNPAVVQILGVHVIQFPYVNSTGEHLDDIWETISAHDYYEAMRAGEPITTSAVSPGRYVEEFEQMLEEGEGKPIVYLCFTEGLSSSVRSARAAAEMVCAEHEGAEIHVVDTRNPSMGTQLLTIEAVHLATNGFTAEEIAAWAEEACYFIHGYFTLESLDWLAKGGRIPPTAAYVGGKLDVKPELSYDLNGALTLRGMCRGRKKALRALVKEFRENFCGDARTPICIVSADAEKDAQWLEDAIRKEPGCAEIPVIRSSLSPTIGAHTGPGMVAFACWGTDRREQQSLSTRIAQRVRGKGGE